MDWKPERNSKIPLYKQIADYIERGISTGKFPADRLLPSERELASRLSVNRSTVVSAYQELQAIGVIERIKGSGTRVSTNIWGLSKKRIPNWGRFLEDGSFIANYPIVQKIRKETEGSSLINFASGELSADLFPSDHFRNIFSHEPFHGHLGYEHPQGNVELRQTIAEHVKQYKQIKTDESSILITSGAQQALHLIVQCLLKPGDAVAIEDPSYSYSLPIFQSAGLKVFHLPVGRDGMDPDDLIRLHKKHRIRMVFLNPDHQNPTGTILHESRRKRILALSSQYGIPIIEDDPYSLTSYDGGVNETLKSRDDNGNVLYISSLSKVVASGLRIGWIIGPTSVIERLSDAKQQIDFGHSIFPQWAANHFLQSSSFNEHLEKIRAALRERRDKIVESLNEHLEGRVEFHIPSGGIHLWCKLNKTVNENELLEQALKKGVAYVPGKILGSADGYVRFTFGRCETNLIEEGIDRFSEAFALC